MKILTFSLISLMLSFNVSAGQLTPKQTEQIIRSIHEYLRDGNANTGLWNKIFVVDETTDLPSKKKCAVSGEGLVLTVDVVNDTKSRVRFSPNADLFYAEEVGNRITLQSGSFDNLKKNLSRSEVNVEFNSAGTQIKSFHVIGTEWVVKNFGSIQKPDYQYVQSEPTREYKCAVNP